MKIDKESFSKLLMVGIVAVLVVIGFQAIRTDAFSSPRKVLDDGIKEIFTSNAREADIVFVTTHKLETGGSDLTRKLSVSAKGIIERSTDDKYAYDGTLDVKNHRPGLDLSFSFLLRYLNNGAYLNIKEMPGTPEINEALLGRWLVLKENEHAPIPAQELTNILQGINNGRILTDLRERGSEKVNGVQAGKYSLEVNQEELKKVVESLANNDQAPDVSRNIGKRTFVIMNNFNLNQLDVWITPRDHKIIRIYLDISPKAEKLKNSSITLDVKLLPIKSAPPAIETPVNAHKFENQEVLMKLMSLGLK